MPKVWPNRAKYMPKKFGFACVIQAIRPKLNNTYTSPRMVLRLGRVHHEKRRSEKVGQVLAGAIEADAGMTLAPAAAPSLGMQLADALTGAESDVVVDFTAPAFAEQACRLCIDAAVPLVLGTSGIAPDRLEQLGADAAAAGVQLFHAANFAIGAVLMMRFAEEAHRHLPAAEIVERAQSTRRGAGSPKD